MRPLLIPALLALVSSGLLSSCSDDPVTSSSDRTATNMAIDMAQSPSQDMALPTADLMVMEDQNDAPDTSASPDMTQAPDMAPSSDMMTAPDMETTNTFEVGSFQTALMIAALNKEVGARVFFPKEKTGETFVVMVSHGGGGNARGEFLYPEMGETLARNGFVAVHVGHREVTTLPRLRRDRPAEVSFLLDALADQRLDLPDDFKGTLNLTRVGHTGHSAGAYTSHAVGGAVFTHGTYTDPRIAAIAPVSPQGAGREFDAFDNGPEDNSWKSVKLPSFILVGRDEISTSGQGDPIENEWRLQPFSRYTQEADRFQVIIDEQDHRDMWSRGSDEVRAYVTTNLSLFFQAYLRGEDVDACTIGTQRADSIPTITIERVRSAQGQLGQRECPSN